MACDPLRSSNVRSLRSTVLACGLALTLAAGLVADDMSIKVDEPFPNLVLRTLDGELKTISDFRGTKVVLHVFASW